MAPFRPLNPRCSPLHLSLCYSGQPIREADVQRASPFEAVSLVLVTAVRQTLDGDRSQGAIARPGPECDLGGLVPGPCGFFAPTAAAPSALHLTHQPGIPCFLCQHLVWSKGPFPPTPWGGPTPGTQGSFQDPALRLFSFVVSFLKTHSQFYFHTQRPFFQLQFE